MWALYRSFPNESIARIRYLIVIARLASRLTVNDPSVALCFDLLFAMFSVIRLLATLVVLTLISTPLFSVPRFTEFMASNNKTLLDEDDDASDWIEIFNPDLTSIDLGGYYLTDDAANLTKWQFPSQTSLNSRAFLVVFASDKNRTVSGSQLHTNFKLSADGEYLALVAPDGSTIVDEISPTYPQQYEDVSYGVQQAGGSVDEILSPETAPCRAFVPPDGALGLSWTANSFNDSAWTAGTLGVGYERSNGYQNLIGTVGSNGEDFENEMYNINSSVYIRIPFDVSNPSEIRGLTLRMKYDDGFVAYLNGSPVAMEQAPTTASWNSSALADHNDALAVEFVDFDISGIAGSLQSTGNVLAIHGMNRNTTSSDMLTIAELVGTRVTDPVFGNAGYMVSATPGTVNGVEQELPESEVTFSQISRTFFGTLSIALSGAKIGQTIRYTTDGTVPTESSTAYTVPISVTATTQIRARIFDPSSANGPICAETYIFLKSDIRTFKTNLPIVILENFGGGRPNEEKVMFMGIIAPDELGDGLAEITDPFHVAARGTMKVRGSSSSGWPKYSMSIEAWDGANKDQDIEPLGFPAESDWVLNSKYQFDRALMRNDLAYQLSNDLGEYAVRTRHVEVINNVGGGDLAYSDDYFGVYSLMEKIKRDSNRVDVKRLSAADKADPRVSGGYLFKEDRLDPGDSGLTVGGAGQLAHIYPKEEDIIPQQRDWLINYLNDFNAAVFANDKTHPSNGKHFTEYIDVDSWLVHHWVNTLAKNVDGFRLSGYYHKDRLGKVVAGPVWDYDRTMESTDSRDNDPETWDGTGGSSKTWYDSRYPWWGEALEDADFKQLHTDLWQRERRPGGALSNDNIASIIDGFNALLTTEVTNSGGILSSPQARNFAQWTAVPPRNGTHDWEVNHLKDWLETRGTWIDSQYTAPPDFSASPGLVAAGTNVFFTGTGGTIYYTTDGSDPRASGGSVAPAAMTSPQPVTINTATPIAVRAVGANGWSSMVEGTFLAGPLADANNLVITELHYAPLPPANSTELQASTQASDFEFIELMNISPTETISLVDVRFVQGIEFNFTGGNVTSLAPSERVLVVANQTAFEARYGNGQSNRIAGEFANDTNLDNDGETIQLIDALDATILLFAYNDQFPWPFDSGISGYSLVLIHDGNSIPGDYSDPTQWRSSAILGGNPAVTDSVTFTGNATDDKDMDGLDALLEHALGTSDDLGGRGHTAYQLQFLELDPAEDGNSATYLTIQHQRNIAADDALIRVEKADAPDAIWTDSGLILHSEEHNGDGTTTLTYRSANPVEILPDDGFFRVVADLR
jgi:hypothetical protein